MNNRQLIPNSMALDTNYSSNSSNSLGIGLASGLFGLAGNLISNITNGIVAKKNLDYNRQLQQQLFDREDNAYQRLMADVSAAGINPSAVLGSGGLSAGQIVDGTNQFKYQDGIGPSVAQGLEAYNSQQSLNMQASQLALNERKLQNESILAEANSNYLNAQAEYISGSKTEESQSNILRNLSQVGVSNAQERKTIAEAQAQEISNTYLPARLSLDLEIMKKEKAQLNYKLNELAQKFSIDSKTYKERSQYEKALYEQRIKNIPYEAQLLYNQVQLGNFEVDFNRHTHQARIKVAKEALSDKDSAILESIYQGVNAATRVYAANTYAGRY